MSPISNALVSIKCVLSGILLGSLSLSRAVGLTIGLLFISHRFIFNCNLIKCDFLACLHRTHSSTMTQVHTVHSTHTAGRHTAEGEKSEKKEILKQILIHMDTRNNKEKSTKNAHRHTNTQTSAFDGKCIAI